MEDIIKLLKSFNERLPTVKVQSMSDLLFDIKYSIDPKIREKTVFIMDSATFQYIKTLKDGSGKSVISDLNSIFAIPVLISEDIKGIKIFLDFT